MLYALHEASYYATAPMRMAARATRDFWASPLNPAAQTKYGRSLYAAADLVTNVTRRYGKPEWGIDKTVVNGVEVRVRPTVVWESPWVKLTQFDRDMSDMRRAGKLGLDPAVLIVAPLSGHYATLLRGRAGSSSCAISAAAASTGGPGWQTAMTCARAPIAPSIWRTWSM